MPLGNTPEGRGGAVVTDTQAQLAEPGFGRDAERLQHVLSQWHRIQGGVAYVLGGGERQDGVGWSVYRDGLIVRIDLS